MLKNSSLTKIICLTTATSFSLAVLLPYQAKAYPLAPLSFRQMYSLAQNGEVEALRASVRRGMNIDVVNSNGDTGLCIAAKRRDSYTYNAFRAAGANPHHPCIQNVDDYEEFVNSSNAVPVTAVPREAYGKIGHESYSISPTTWWVLGGLVVAGGITAAVLAGGGGGSSKSDGNDGKKHPEEYDSFGTNAGSDAKTYKKTASSAVLEKSLSVSNNKISAGRIEKINLLSDVMNTTQYMYRGLLARRGGTYTNSPKGILEIGTASIGMTAVNKSKVINNGYIKADSANATVAMVASNSSTAINNASGIIDRTSSLGIDLNFSGNKETKTVVGMYADTNSSIINNGDIRGTATKAIEDKSGEKTSGSSFISTTADSTTVSTAIKGNIVGMEAMILNVGSDVQSDSIFLTNSSTGRINLSAGDNGSTATVVNLTSIGMGSFLDDGFTNGSKNINRAEKVYINNEGRINIGYTGKYQTADETPLRKGTGGIVGIRAEANTEAVNAKNGVITLTLTDYGSSGGSVPEPTTDTGAGMQSLHGANITNNGTINIITNARNQVINYGMLAVEGNGTVSGLYTNAKQVLNNNGKIYVEASNSYGMTSYNGGTLNNNADATIVVGKDMGDGASIDADTLYINNVGMYASGDNVIVRMHNYGTIDVFSYQSTAMKNNFSGGNEICNESIINIHSSATGSKVFDGYYSVVRNNGTINYDLSEGGIPSKKGTEGDPFAYYKLTVNKSVMTTKSSANSDSSTTEFAYNNEGKYINLNGSSFTSVLSVETERGVAENYGIIKLNENKFGSEGNGVGMYLNNETISAAYIDNIGTIETNFYMSAAMASNSTQNAAMVNHGTIKTQKEYSIGMYASYRTLIKNYGGILINGENSVAILSNGSSDIINEENATINVGTADKSVYNSFGIFSKADSKGGSGGSSGGGSIAINNLGTISLYSSNGAAIKSTGSESTIINTGTIEGLMMYGIYTEDNNSVIVNNGTIGSSESRPSIGINVIQSGSNITNSGKIYASDKGIYAYAAGESEKEKTVISNTGEIHTEHYGVFVTVASEGTYLIITNSGTIDAPHPVYLDCQYEKPDKPGPEFEINFNVPGGTEKKYKTSTTSGSSAISTGILHNIRFVNTGLLNINSSLNFDGEDVSYIIGQNGSYQATSLSGTVFASSDIVQDGFDDSYTNKNSLIGQDDGVNVISQSFMFTASKITNNEGNTDVVMTRRPFTELTQNSSIASFLENNYILNNNEVLYNSLKTTSNQNDFNRALNKKLGLNFIPNLAKQNLDNERIVQNEINSDLLEITNENKRHISKILTYRNKVGNKDNTSGYKDNIIALYGINDIKIKDNIRIGLGLSAIRADSDYKDNSNRYNNTIEIFTPLIIQNNTTSALIKPKAGFGRGHYRRTADNGKNKAQTKEYYYGIDSAAKHSINTSFVDIEPNTSLSLTGMYMKGDNESNKGIHLKSKNILSAVYYAGLDINKEILFNKEHSIKLTASGKYYHEFGNKYTQKATLEDMVGTYNIESNRLNRDFGLLSLKAKYSYNNLSIQTSVNTPIESKHNTFYMFDLGYNF